MSEMTLAQKAAESKNILLERGETPCCQTVHPHDAVVHRRTFCSRFLWAVVVVALVWFGGAMIVRHLSPMIHSTPSSYIVKRGSASEMGPSLLPANVTIDHCVPKDGWKPSLTHSRVPSTSDFPFKGTASFDLHLSAEDIFLLATGPQSSGSVQIVTSSSQASGNATVEIDVSYYLESIRDKAQVCMVHREAGSTGVMIFTDESMRSHLQNETLQFATIVTLPNLTLTINKFETDVNYTSHDVGNLTNVLFQSIHLKGTDGEINVTSLNAVQGQIETTNARITGNFNSSNSLTLSTSAAEINADVVLVSVKGSKPSAELRSSDAAINARFSLLSSTWGGTYNVKTITTDGRLNIGFPASPVNSILTFDGSTTDSHATVSLNPAYEGNFSISTTDSSPTLNVDESVKDPSGKGRQRKVNEVKEKSSITGDVHWQDSSAKKTAGVVNLKTSNAPVVLNI